MKAGEVFGRLTVLGPDEPKRNPSGYWIYRVKAKCECGRIATVYESKLRYGSTRSCGCLERQTSIRNLPKGGHGHARHGQRTPIYSTWRSMIDRCNSPSTTGYHSYGGRGIKVCDRWHNFLDFVADVGERPKRASLDRIDNDGNYEPSNCRWATHWEQAANRGNTIKVVFRGEAIHLAEVGRRVGIDAGNIRRYARRYKMDIQAAVDHYAAKYPNEFNPDNMTSTTEYPTVLLRIECASTNPPRPVGIGVFVDRKPIAILSLAELRKTAKRLEEIETTYFDRNKN